MVLGWAFVYLAAAVACHALATRLPTRGNSVTWFVLLGGAAGLALAVQLFAGHGLTIATFAALAVYAFACELYIFLFTLVGTSIGVKLLLALRDGALSSDQIEALCSPTGMVERRLGRLHAVGLLEADGRRVSPKGRRLVQTFLALREFFLPVGERLITPARKIHTDLAASVEA